MELALEQAKEAQISGEVPVGAVFVDNGEVISASGNQPIGLDDPTAHAEILALRKAAEIKGFTEGGKTGTVHKIKKGSGYAQDSYRASFIGIAPLSDKSLTIFVSIDEPGLNSYTGGSVAAPVFAKIAESSLNHLGYFEDE